MVHGERFPTELTELVDKRFGAKAEIHYLENPERFTIKCLNNESVEVTSYHFSVNNLEGWRKCGSYNRPVT